MQTGVGMLQRSGLHLECSMRQTVSQPQCLSVGLPARRQLRRQTAAAARSLVASRQRRLSIVATYPEPETEKERSPIDIPQEWITPQPSRRPDIFPEFEKQATPLPKPLPGDPEVPDEEEEEEKKKKKEPEKPEEEPEKPEKEGPAPSE